MLLKMGQKPQCLALNITIPDLSSIGICKHVLTWLLFTSLHKSSKVTVCVLRVLHWSLRLCFSWLWSYSIR